jgi:hypothetical protein
MPPRSLLMAATPPKSQRCSGIKATKELLILELLRHQEFVRPAARRRIERPAEAGHRLRHARSDGGEGLHHLEARRSPSGTGGLPRRIYAVTALGRRMFMAWTPCALSDQVLLARRRNQIHHDNLDFHVRGPDQLHEPQAVLRSQPMINSPVLPLTFGEWSSPGIVAVPLLIRTGALAMTFPFS